MRPRRHRLRPGRPPRPGDARVPGLEGLQPDDHLAQVRPQPDDLLRLRLRALDRRRGRHRDDRRRPGHRPPGPGDADRRADPHRPAAAGDDAPAPGDLARGPAGRNELRPPRPLRPRPRRLPPARRPVRRAVERDVEARTVAAADQPPRRNRKPRSVDASPRSGAARQAPQEGQGRRQIAAAPAAKTDGSALRIRSVRVRRVASGGRRALPDPRRRRGGPRERPRDGNARGAGAAGAGAAGGRARPTPTRSCRRCR